MKYYYIGENRNAVGPISEEQVRLLVKDGILSADSELSEVGSDQWSTVEALITETEAQDEAVRENISQSFTKKVAISRKIATLQAKIERTRRIELPAKLFEFGEMIINSRTGALEAKDLFEQLAKLDTELEALGILPNLDEEAGFLDKSKHHAERVNRAVQSKALRVKKRRLITDIGQRVIKLKNLPESLTAQVSEIRNIELTVQAMVSERAALSKEVKSSFKKQIAGYLGVIQKRPKLSLILGIAGVSVCCGTVFMLNRNEAIIPPSEPRVELEPKVKKAPEVLLFLEKLRDERL